MVNNYRFGLTFLFIWSVFLYSCRFSKVSESDDETISCEKLSFEFIKENFLNKNIDSLPILDCLDIKDTIIENDEGVSWEGKIYLDSTNAAFLAETNWVNRKRISRITILNSLIKEGNLAVGKKLEDIRDMISNKIPSAPDGYLFLEHYKDKDINIQMDISDYSYDSPLYMGALSLDKMPNNLKIESIVIMDR